MSTPARLRPSCRLRRPSRPARGLGGLLALVLLLAPLPAPGAGAGARVETAAPGETAPQAGDPAPRVVTGVVLDGAGNAPIAAATVASGAETVATDADGRFSVTLAPDDAGLRVAADGYLETTVALEPAVAGAGAALEILLFRNTFAETVQVVSTPAAVPERAAATPIAAAEVFEVAGAFDNIFRTLDTLPGVASTGDFGSRLAVRGGTPDQNLTVMDGVEIHNPYRLFGLVSAFNPETVERFELTAGGFGAAYGDRLSSLLIVDNRVGESDFSGSTSAGVTDANVVLEGGAPGGGSWLLSGRRTYYDLVAGLVTDQSLPAFADVQAQAHWTFGPGHRLALFGLTSRENADFRFDDEEDEESRDSGRLVSEAGNDLVSLRLDALLGGAATSRTIVSWYRNTDVLGVDATFESSARRSNAPDDAVGAALTNVVFDRDLSVRDLSVRQELAFPLSPAHTLDTGVELHRLASGAGLSITGDRNETVANPSSVRGGAGLPDSLDSSLAGTRGGAWIQDRYTITPRLSVEPGLRLDWSTVNGDAVLSPRFAATLALGRASRLRVAGGLYTQSPGYEKLIQSDYFFDLSPAVVTGLRHERATHLVTGFEQELGADTLFRVEGYYKTFDDLIVGGLEPEAERRARVARYDFPAALQASVPAAARITSTPVNGGGGRAYGADVYLVRSDPAARLAGWLSYAWGRADRDTYGLRYPFEYDRPHAFNAVGRYRLGDRWSIAATAQFATGFPYTPAVGVRVADEEDSRGRLVPARDTAGALIYTVDLGGLDALQRGRLPHYARVDLRIAHQPGGPSGRWLWYIEVINLLNRDNPVEFETELAHDPDRGVPRIVESPSAGFPIIPSFGVRIRF
ncbi:MAG: TonB-dependent receptor [Acidobacteria bacterium]|nr:TonB-dependent receptor [Acidobacteriota bacterium]